MCDVKPNHDVLDPLSTQCILHFLGLSTSMCSYKHPDAPKYKELERLLVPHQVPNSKFNSDLESD